MLDIITSNHPDVRPAVTRPEAVYPHPAAVSIQIIRNNINEAPNVKLLMRNFRLLVDDNTDPITLEDGVTQKGEYGVVGRQYEIDNLYTWVASRPNAAALGEALNTLFLALVTWDEEQQDTVNP